LAAEFPNKYQWEVGMDYRKKFLAEPGVKVRLSKIDPLHGPARKPGEGSAQDSKKRRSHGYVAIPALSGRQPIPSCGLAGARRCRQNGVIRHVFSGMNPQGSFVFGFKQPRRAPSKDEVVIFNRSHYEDVLVVRVHKLVPHSVWSKRYDLINDFETVLVRNNTTILKFFLHISPRAAAGFNT
jgi:hypothetical protein